MVGGLASPLAISDYVDKATSATGSCEFSSLPPGFVYLNSGTEGSMPDCVLSTFQNKLLQWASNPTTSYELNAELGKHQHLNREAAARFFGVEKNNICLTDNTTMGCNMTLLGLNFRPNDKVVTTNHEHNAIRSPLQVVQERQGLNIETRFFPPAKVLRSMSSTQLLDFLFPNIPALQGAKALCVSHVYPTTGVRLPLSLLRQKADELNIPYLVVDGAQAMGMVDLGKQGDSLENCDFYAGPGHKWMNGPPGTGVLYIRNADIRPPEFYPTVSQRMSKYTDCGNNTDTCFPMAEALQVRGCSNTPGFAAMLTAMKFIENAGGAAQVEKHILGLAQKVKNSVLSRSPGSIISPHADSALQSGLSAFFPFKWDKPELTYQDKKTADWVVQELMKKSIQVRSIGFANSGSSDQRLDTAYAIRVSTAYFNSADDIASFSIALQEVLKKLP
jgi:selenocysteine lyase/cysteine desulfurase